METQELRKWCIEMALDAGRQTKTQDYINTAKLFEEYVDKGYDAPIKFFTDATFALGSDGQQYRIVPVDD